MNDLPPGSRAAIETKQLTKHYGTVAALQDLDLSVPIGTIYGFLGPNGAGKTTTIKILMGFIRPSSGHGTIFGHETWSQGVRARRHVGFLVQPDNLYPDMTGNAHLTYAEQLGGKPAVLRRRMLEALELGAEALER